MGTFVVKIRFGSESARDDVYSKEHPYDEYTFDTEKEMLAFFRGVDAMDGWLGYETVEDE
jgi:hypothetical protein